MAESDVFECSICKFRFRGYGNNPWPVTQGEDDRCCDDCNAIHVVPARIANLRKATEETDSDKD